MGGSFLIIGPASRTSVWIGLGVAIFAEFWGGITELMGLVKGNLEGISFSARRLVGGDKTPRFSSVPRGLECPSRALSALHHIDIRNTPFNFNDHRAIDPEFQYQYG